MHDRPTDYVAALSVLAVATTSTSAQGSDRGSRHNHQGETSSINNATSALAAPSSSRSTTADITPSQAHGDSMHHNPHGDNTGSPNVSLIRQQSRSSEALILGLAIPFAILLFGIMLGLSIFLYRYSGRKNKAKKASRQPMFSGDLEDKNGDFWASSNYGSSPHSGQLTVIESGGFARDGNERQMKLVDTSTEWGKNLPPPEQGFRGQLINPNFALAPLRKPPSIVTFPVPADIPAPSEITNPESFVNPGHSRQPSQAFSDTDSTLSYVSYKDDAAYNKVPVTSYYPSTTKPSPTATKLNMYRFPHTIVDVI